MIQGQEKSNQWLLTKKLHWMVFLRNKSLTYISRGGPKTIYEPSRLTSQLPLWVADPLQ